MLFGISNWSEVLTLGRRWSVGSWSKRTMSRARMSERCHCNMSWYYLPERTGLREEFGDVNQPASSTASVLCANSFHARHSSLALAPIVQSRYATIRCSLSPG